MNIERFRALVDECLSTMPSHAVRDSEMARLQFFHDDQLEQIGMLDAYCAAEALVDERQPSVVAQWSPEQATRSVAVFRFNNGTMIHTEIYVDCKAYEMARDWLEQTMGCEVTYRGWMSNCTVCDLILN